MLPILFPYLLGLYIVAPYYLADAAFVDGPPEEAEAPVETATFGSIPRTVAHDAL